MRRALAFLLLPLAAASVPLIASAQNNLTAEQARGRAIITQNCNICHLPQSFGSQQTYGPLLSKAAANGDEALMRQVIENGLVKMPGWKYTLSPQQISDVISYLKIVPVPPPAPPAAKGANKATTGEP
jgi:mono/diheme cytochrome c family protein